MCSILVLGVIGFIGESVFDLLMWVGGLLVFCIVVLSGVVNVVWLVEMVCVLWVEVVVMVLLEKLDDLCVVLVGSGIEVVVGVDVIVEVVVCFVDWMLLVIIGVVGLLLGFEVLCCVGMLVFVNKESFVVVGWLVMGLVVDKGVMILLVDLEYFVIF